MPGHLARFLESHPSPGLIIVSQDLDIGAAIADLSGLPPMLTNGETSSVLCRYSVKGDRVPAFRLLHVDLLRTLVQAGGEHAESQGIRQDGRWPGGWNVSGRSRASAGWRPAGA